MQVFAEPNNELYTFEVVMYAQNTEICDELFLPGRRTLSVQNYMLGDKSEVAYELLDKKRGELAVPNYISEAIAWINE